MADSEGPPRRRSPLFWSAAALGAVFLAVWLFLYFGGWFAGDDPAPPAPAVSSSPSASRPVLAEFADFNCPYCRRFALRFMPEIRRKFIEPGLLDYEYRHMPFLAQSSFDAAEYAECARMQGRFREFHDALYAVEPAGYLTAPDLDLAAESSSLDPAALDGCLRSGEGLRRVEADIALSAEAGVRGTPTLFLDGELLRWSGYYELEELIYAALE